MLALLNVLHHLVLLPFSIAAQYFLKSKNAIMLSKLNWLKGTVALIAVNFDSIKIVKNDCVIWFDDILTLGWL